MKKICRLSISYDGEMDDGGDMRAVVNAGLEKAGITMADIELKGDSYGDNTHYGNWVLTPVLNNDATARLAAAFGTQIDMEREIIEAADIAGLNIGQRVTVGKMGDFFFCRMEGKIIAKKESEISILKKGSRSKGMVIKVGDEATIRATA